MLRKNIIFDTGILFVLLIFFVFQLPVSILFSYVIGLIYLLSMWSRSRIQRKHLNLCLFLAAIFLPAALTFNHGVVPLFYLFVSPFLICLAYVFSMNSLRHIKKVCGNIYWICVFFIVIALIQNWSEPEPLGAIIPWASTNGIPSYLIVVQIAYSIAFYLKKNRLPMVSTTITLGVAILGLGRGSIVVGALILLLSFYLNIFLMRSVKDRLFVIFSMLFVIASLLLFFGEKFQIISSELQELIEGSKFASGILDEHRGRIFSDYLNKMDGWSLVFGASYSDTSINESYGGNPHNSFIRLHSFYGLAGIISLFVPIILVLVSLRNRSQKLVVLSFVMLALLRATSEPIFFPSTLDFFYFLYFLIFFRFAKMEVNFKADFYDSENNHCKNS